MTVSTSALSELKSALGAEHVVTERTTVGEYERATFGTTQRIPLVVLPGSAEEVQAVVRIANQHRLRLYPVSRGRNWGLGSRVPVESGCCVVDLKRMDRIIELDEKNAVLTVEPGVTFAQVAELLKSRGTNLYLPAIGGPPDSSVLANALERGDGIGPIGDRAKYCNALEVVLPTGERLHTGLDCFGNSLAGKIAQFGLGPAVEGLFFQSNLGIVTRMSVWLARRPRYFQSLVFAAYSEEELVAATTALRELQQQGVLHDTSYSLWNVYRFLTAQIQYPWGPEGQQPTTPEKLLERLPAAWKGVKWVGFVGLYAPSALHAVSSRWMVRRALQGKVRRFFVVDPVVARVGRVLEKPLQRLTGVDVKKMLDALYFESVFTGQPTKLETNSIYWRKRGPKPTTCDPDRDRCGLHWLVPALPFDGEHIARVTKMVEEVALRHGLEPLSMFFNMNQWYLKSFIVIMYDQDAPGEEEAARRCHDELFTRLDEAGYSPVRLGIQSMALGAPTEPEYIALIQRLKRALDPNDILAPGRYDFRHRWPAATRNEPQRAPVSA